MVISRERGDRWPPQPRIIEMLEEPLIGAGWQCRLVQGDLRVAGGGEDQVERRE